MRMIFSSIGASVPTQGPNSRGMESSFLAAASISSPAPQRLVRIPSKECHGDDQHLPRGPTISPLRINESHSIVR